MGRRGGGGGMGWVGLGSGGASGAPGAGLGCWAARWAALRRSVPHPASARHQPPPPRPQPLPPTPPTHLRRHRVGRVRVEVVHHRQRHVGLPERHPRGRLGVGVGLGGGGQGSVMSPAAEGGADRAPVGGRPLPSAASSLPLCATAWAVRPAVAPTLGVVTGAPSADSRLTPVLFLGGAMWRMRAGWGRGAGAGAGRERGAATGVSGKAPGGAGRLPVRAPRQQAGSPPAKTPRGCGPPPTHPPPPPKGHPRTERTNTLPCGSSDAAAGSEPAVENTACSHTLPLFLTACGGGRKGRSG
jgi:hypothetical protein